MPSKERISGDGGVKYLRVNEQAWERAVSPRKGRPSRYDYLLADLKAGEIVQLTDEEVGSPKEWRRMRNAIQSYCHNVGLKLDTRVAIGGGYVLRAYEEGQAS